MWVISMWKIKNSLKNEILKYFLIFSILILVILWLMESILFKSLYKEQRMNDIYYTSSKIKKSDTSTLVDTLNNLALEKSLCIEVDNATFRQVYTSSYFGKDCVSNIPATNQYKYDFIVSGKDEKTYQLNHPNLDMEMVVHAIKLQNNQYVFINTTLEPVDGTIFLLQKELIIISILIIIFSYISAHYISNHISKPIKEVTDQAKKLSTGDFKLEFNENSKILEIEELSKTLNYTKEELSKIDELRKDLMANVSHDLKTPLTMIKATAEITKDLHINKKEKIEEDMNTIIYESDRLTNLVNDILELSKEEAVNEELHLEEFELIQFIQNILKQYQVLIEKEDYHFNFLHSDEEIVIQADKKKLEQVFYNLINNAIQYTGSDNQVTIQVEKKKDILIKIIDTGNGIKEEDIPYIWDRYYKSEKMHKRNIVGTGLGLNIVKKILERHHFSYGVDSTIGVGSTFYFRIPKKKR